MNRAWHRTQWLVMALCGGAMVANPLFGQLSSNSPAPIARANNAPPLPPQRSPVESFREWLVMPSAERGKFLAVYPLEIRAQIQQKIVEYQSLTPDERGLRLQVTELRWYLLPLLNLPTTNRAEQLALIPPAMRELVEPRLQRWTMLPPQLRQVLLTNEQAVGYLIRGDSPTNPPPASAKDQRRKLSESFSRLLEFTPQEKENALRVLSDAERRQMEKTLEAFRNLPPNQRDQCVRWFASFAALSAADQQEFLKNAEQWSQMSLAEREAWRELVSLAATLPPLPPLRLPKPPPLPIGFPDRVATNGN